VKLSPQRKKIMLAAAAAAVVIFLFLRNQAAPAADTTAVDPTTGTDTGVLPGTTDSGDGGGFGGDNETLGALLATETQNTALLTTLTQTLAAGGLSPGSPTPAGSTAPPVTLPTHPEGPPGSGSGGVTGLPTHGEQPGAGGSSTGGSLPLLPLLHEGTPVAKVTVTPSNIPSKSKPREPVAGKGGIGTPARAGEKPRKKNTPTEKSRPKKRGGPVEHPPAHAPVSGKTGVGLPPEHLAKAV
jgi:hypothetical protein